MLGASTELRVSNAPRKAVGSRETNADPPLEQRNNTRFHRNSHHFAREMRRERLSVIEPVPRREATRIDPDERCHGGFEMIKVLVLYYSAYGHIEQMAYAIAEGARRGGAQVDVKRVPELVPDAVARAAHFKLDQVAPLASIEDLAEYDAIVVGVGTRFGRMASQMASFLDQGGGLWARGALHGKVGGAFTSSATQHGGNETTLFSIITNLLHFGMVVVGLPYSHQGQMTLEEIVGGAPYGATTIAGADGARQPSALELAGARHQGELVAETAAKLFACCLGARRTAHRQWKRWVQRGTRRPLCALV